MNKLNRFLTQLALGSLVLLVGLTSPGAFLHAQTTLSNIPVFSAFSVPANLMLALSVEFPTGNVAAYTDNKIPLVYTDSDGTTHTIACAGPVSGFGVCYFPLMRYLGYFDNAKCYTYHLDLVPANSYFVPAGSADDGCVGRWSGNMLNWASMTTLDEFRLTLTGGNRVFDTTALTVLQRSRQTGQGGAGNFPNKQLGATVNVAPLSVIGALPFSAASNVYIRSRNGGTELTNGTDKGVFIEFSDNSSFANAPPGKNSTLYYARVQVCVPSMLEDNCNSAHAVSDYPNAGNYNKPDGLIQRHANQIRVGASGYLYAFGAGHPNGTLRALLRDNGPTKYNGLGARQPNPNAEWDGGTGAFIKNPDPTVATASGVPNSGAINYANQFGYNEPGYETQDTLAELYWATLSYYKNLPLDASYTAAPNPGNSIQLDAFPAINFANAPDPIHYSCQGSAIVTIGDSHTWCDTRIPGSSKDSSGTGSCSNQSPLAVLTPNGTTPIGSTPPAGIDPGLNAAAYVKALGNLPLIEAFGATAASNTMAGYAGVGDLSSIYEFNTPPGATYNMAGMAYYAHTQDIRGDDPTYVNPVSHVNSTTGKQTVDTYTVDVMEPGSYDGSLGNETYNPGSLSHGPGPNMYWLAAKYGGFDIDDTKFATIGTVQLPYPASPLAWHTNSTTVAGKNYRPDNYFPGDRPDLIQSGLSTIFDRVASKTPLSTAGPGTSSTRSLQIVAATIYKNAAAGFALYNTKYTPGDWTGDVLGSVSALAADGTVSPVNIGAPPVPLQWSAKTHLDAMTQLLDATLTPMGWNTTRRIITMGTSGGTPFRYGSLSAAQQAALNGDSALLDFLRGDRSNEGTNYRVRRSVLGDIVNSQAVLVQGALSLSYSDATNPGYSAFMSAQANRAPMIYVGANDGMLHAFSADFTGVTGATPPPAPALADGGNELFAYVPSFLFNGPNGTPNVDGLAALGNLGGITARAYAHHFYVDQTPQIADADFDRTGLTPGGSGTPDWHTVLVGAAGKGGKGIYALDVTTVPAALSAGTSAAQEALIKNKVLWEFAPADMGYIYGKPSLAKTRKYGWVVLVTTGYNNASGIGQLFVLNAKTGALLEPPLVTVGGSPGNPYGFGLGRLSAYTQDFSDNTIEQVYAGDLHGNVWRFDLSSAAAGLYPAPTLLATLTAPDGTVQPITTAPRIETDIDSTGFATRRWVFVGTGRFLDLGDLTNAQTQTMYALRDGTAALPSCINAIPVPTVCVANPNGLPTARAGLAAITNLLTGVTIADNAAGWYFDLPGNSGGAGAATERVIVDPDTQAGLPIIVWATLVPTIDPCSYQGAIYAVNYGSGRSVLLGGPGGTMPVASVIPPGGAPTGVSIQQTSTGSITILYGTLHGTGGLLPNVINVPPALSRTNWREILN